MARKKKVVLQEQAPLREPQQVEPKGAAPKGIVIDGVSARGGRVAILVRGMESFGDEVAAAHDAKKAAEGNWGKIGVKARETAGGIRTSPEAGNPDTVDIATTNGRCVEVIFGARRKAVEATTVAEAHRVLPHDMHDDLFEHKTEVTVTGDYAQWLLDKLSRDGVDMDRSDVEVKRQSVLSEDYRSLRSAHWGNLSEQQRDFIRQLEEEGFVTPSVTVK